MKKNIIVGVTSGIAAFKALDLVTQLKAEGLHVFVVMTKNATKMVNPSKFQKASGNKVYLDLFEKDFDYREVLKKREVEHIALADKADAMVIIPATANIVGKLSYGIASDFLTTTALAVTAPVLICPSMNVNMWQNPLVQENIKRLRKNGYHIVEPAEGMLACGYEGKGRLEEIEFIKKEILTQLKRGDSLKGKRVVITAGGTSEKIDNVRFITNRSSGKMGVALAEECYLRGADVLLLRAENAVKPRYLMAEKTFNEVDDLELLVKKEAKNADIFFQTAAVSDFKPAKPVIGKISSKKSINLKLIPTTKILNQIKKLNPKIKLIAFKAEYGLSDQEMINKGLEKLQESKADAVVVNDVSKKDRGFEVDTNEVIVVLKSGKSKKIPLASKKEIAKIILDKVI